MFRLVSLASVGLVLTSAQVDYVSECPVDNGIFADALQCDRYYECTDGEVSEEFCPDGLVFDERSETFAKCSFPFSIDCTGREDLQPAQPTPGCPRQHGYFAYPDPEVCHKFNFCVDGVPNTITCPGGLIFDPTTGGCAYSDQTDRPGCTSDALFGFRCPDKDTPSPHEHSRHPDPSDCQFFYLCIEGKARRNGCSVGMVFNPISLSCERQDKVEGPCSNWYNETFIESLNPQQNNNLRQSTIQNRRRPARPQQSTVPRRQQLRPEAPLPQQLADLDGFGRQPTSGSGSRRQQPRPESALPQQLVDLDGFGQQTTPGSRRQQFRPEPALPQQLSDQDRFGLTASGPRRQQFQQEQTSGFGSEDTAGNFASNFVRTTDQFTSFTDVIEPSSFSQPAAPAVTPVRSNRPGSGGGRGRVRQRQRGAVPRRRPEEVTQEEEEDIPKIQSDGRQTFFNNLRSSVTNRATVSPARTPFTRPPRRRPEELRPVEAVPVQRERQDELPDQAFSRPKPFVQLQGGSDSSSEEEVGQFESFGRRRNPSRSRGQSRSRESDSRQPDSQDLLGQVEAELARRESLLEQEETFVREPQVLRQRGRARGGSAGRSDDAVGRLQVLWVVCYCYPCLCQRW